MNTPRRGVLIGAGAVARLAHLPGYAHQLARAAGLSIVAAVDARPDCPPIDGIPVYQSIADAMRHHQLDFADICTPTASHHALIRESLMAGLHVICEKPVALTRVQAIELVNASMAANRVLFPCHQYRHNPAWQMLRKWIDEGSIGRWHLAEFQVYRGEADRAGAAANVVPWRGLRETSLGGVLLDHGTHLLYLLTDVAGMPAAVTAHVATLAHPEYDVEDTAHLIFDFPERMATLTLTWAGVGRENRIRFVGTQGQAEWNGGMLQLTAADGSVVVAEDFRAQLDKREYSGWMARTLAQFADAMERQVGTDAAQEIIRTATLLEASYQSASQGLRVAL